MKLRLFSLNKAGTMSKVSLLSLIIMLSSFSAFGQNINPNYDAKLAEKLGADEYGMKSYILVILKTGSNKVTDKAVKSELFRGHMENIHKLVDDKKLIVAGPLGKNEKYYRGIFILDVASIEEATSLLQTDPAIKANLFDVEMYKWHGSAALAMYLEASDKIWKISP